MFFFTSELSCSDHQQFRLVAVKRRQTSRVYSDGLMLQLGQQILNWGSQWDCGIYGKRLYFGFTVQFTVNFLTFLNFNFKE